MCCLAKTHTLFAMRTTPKERRAQTFISMTADTVKPNDCTNPVCVCVYGVSQPFSGPDFITKCELLFSIDGECFVLKIK